MTQNPLNAYRETRVKTASPGQIVVMLYGEAVRQCDAALELLERDVKTNPQHIEKVNTALVKVQDVITELMASLDFDAGGEIAQNLFSLYVFWNREVMDANIRKDAAKIAIIRRQIDDLRSAWVVVASQPQETGREARVGVNIAG